MINFPLIISLILHINHIYYASIIEVFIAKLTLSEDERMKFLYIVELFMFQKMIPSAE